MVVFLQYCSLIVIDKSLKTMMVKFLGRQSPDVGCLPSSAAGKTGSVCGAVLDIPPIPRMVGDGGGAPYPSLAVTTESGRARLYHVSILVKPRIFMCALDILILSRSGRRPGSGHGVGRKIFCAPPPLPAAGGLNALAELSFRRREPVAPSIRPPLVCRNSFPVFGL